MLPPEEKQEETAPPKKIQEMTQPPAPWNDWDEVRQVRETLQEHRFLVVKHPQHLTGEEHEVLADLLNSPIGEQIQVLYSFMKDWYAFGYSQDRHRLPPEEALGRYRAWRSNEGYQQNKVLLRILERITPERFDHLYHFLANERWEATNNGAESAGREFRHQQAPHFNLRSEESIIGMLTVHAVSQMQRSISNPYETIGLPTRGRIPGLRRERMT